MINSNEGAQARTGHVPQSTDPNTTLQSIEPTRSTYKTEVLKLIIDMEVIITINFI